MSSIKGSVICKNFAKMYFARFSFFLFPLLFYDTAVVGINLELIKALKVQNERFTIGCHVNLSGFRVRVFYGLGRGFGVRV